MAGSAGRDSAGRDSAGDERGEDKDAARSSDAASAPEATPATGPATLWAAVRLDALVLLLVLGALAVNVISPDPLSPAITPLLFLAAAWVTYRIVRARQAFRARD